MSNQIEIDLYVRKEEHLSLYLLITSISKIFSVIFQLQRQNIEYKIKFELLMPVRSSEVDHIHVSCFCGINKLAKVRGRRSIISCTSISAT